MLGAPKAHSAICLLPRTTLANAKRPTTHPSSADGPSANPLGRGLSTRECFSVNGYDLKPSSGPSPWSWSKSSKTASAPSRGLFGESVMAAPSFSVGPAATISFGVPPTPQSTFGQAKPSSSLFGPPSATQTSTGFSFNETGEKLVAITQKPEYGHKSLEEMRFEHRGGINPFAPSNLPPSSNLFGPLSVPVAHSSSPPMNLFGPVPLPSVGPADRSATESKPFLFDNGVKSFTSVRFGGALTEPVVSSSEQGNPFKKCAVSTTNPFANAVNPFATVSGHNPFATPANPFSNLGSISSVSQSPFGKPHNSFTNAAPSPNGFASKPKELQNPFGVPSCSTSHVRSPKNPFASKLSPQTNFTSTKPRGSGWSENWTFGSDLNRSNDETSRNFLFGSNFAMKQGQTGITPSPKIGPCFSIDRVSVPISDTLDPHAAKPPAPPTFTFDTSCRPQTARTATHSEGTKPNVASPPAPPTLIATPDGDPYGAGKIGAGLVESTVRSVLGKEDMATPDSAVLALPTNTTKPTQFGSRASAFIRRGPRKYQTPASVTVVHTPSPRKFSSGLPPSASKLTVNRLVVGRSDMEPWKRGEFRFKTSIFARAVSSPPPQ